MHYLIDVIVPLPIDTLFTYKVNKIEYDFLKNGYRVIVPFGKSKLLTAIVVKKHNILPEFYDAKHIEFIIDEEPIINDFQIKFFNWMSNYYMCPIGQVIKVSIPSLLLLKSESEIVLYDELKEDMKLTDSADLLYNNLLLNKKLTYREVISILKKQHVTKTINELLNYSIIKLKEEVYDYFKPKNVIKIYFNKKLDNNAFDLLLDELKTKKSQQKVLKSLFSLSKNVNPTIQELINYSGVSRATINTLVDTGILAKKSEIINRIQFQVDQLIKPKDLSFDQKNAFKNIISSFKNKNVSLLHGVTSSGKTEIYVKLIENEIKKNKQVLYLVPEIALTTQLINRLKKYFGNLLAVYHSKYSINQRTEVWKKVLKNDKNAKIIIGARSSIFLPFSKLSLIIVDEEHENAYKQFKPAPRYHARDSAIYLAMLHKANTLLGSATPSLESYFNAISNKYGLISLDKRFGDIKPPKIIIKDLKQAILKKNITGNFSNLFLEKIKITIENKKQVIIFQNRRGYAPYLECSSCAYVYQCINCDVSLTYHQVSDELKCHHCGYCVKNKTICPTCAGNTVIKKGLGTQQVVEELKEFFPSLKIERMDHDSTRNKNAFSNIINDFENNEFQVLVGTQMLAKGLDFKNVDLVGVVNADSLIYFPDFRSQEKCFQLIQQVAGRSGRSKKQGEVIVQTFNPNHQLMKKIVKNDFLGMFKEQLNERFLFQYPPYSRLIKLTLKHKNLNILQKCSIWLADALKNQFKNQMLGPESPLISRINNKHIKNILIKIPNNSNLKFSKTCISKILKSFNTISAFRNADISIDVDPYN